MKCFYKEVDTGLGYFNFKSSCGITVGRLPNGWKYCPYCGREIDKTLIQPKMSDKDDDTPLGANPFMSGSD